MTAKIGGTVAERWSEGDGDERVSRDASGEVDVVVREHALGFRWKEADDERSTAVLITLRTMDDGTAVTVTETGFDSLSDAAHRAAASQDGWNVLLRDLAAAAEADTGDLAFSEDEAPSNTPAVQSPAKDVVEEDSVDEHVEHDEHNDEEGLDAANTAPIPLHDSAEDVGDSADAVENSDTKVLPTQSPRVAEPSNEAVTPTSDVDFDDLIRGRR